MSLFCTVFFYNHSTATDALYDFDFSFPNHRHHHLLLQSQQKVQRHLL